jgi:EspA/EspE family
MAGVLDGFLSTWSNARATFGQGDPPAGAQYDRSSQLRQAQSDLAGAAPGSSWSGAAADAYGKANDDHRQVIGQLASLDQRLSAQVDRSAEVVTKGRQDLDAVRKWVVDAAASVPNDAAGQRLLVPIVNKGISQMIDIVQKTNGELGTIGGNVRGIGAEYTALGNQKFAKESKGDEGDALGATGNESEDDVEKHAKEDVEKTLEGDQEAAGRVDEVLHDIKPYQPLSAEQAAYLHQMQVQQKDMSIQDLHAAEQQLGEHQNVIGDSWQLMSNDDVKYDDPDHPGSQITGGRDQLPTHVKTMMSLGTIADDFNRTGETEVKDMAQILKDGRVELQTGTEVDRGMIELSDRLMDNPTPTNEQAVRDIFDSAGRDHQIITDQMLGRNEGGRDGFLHDVNSIDWQDGGKSAGNLFSWTHDAVNGPEAGIAAQTADQYADYLGNPKNDLLHMPGFGDQTLGQHNPELVRAYAHGLTPYMADIAGVNGDNRFPDLDNGNPERPMAKQLFAVLGTDREAYVEFNGAADQLGLDKAHAWAEDVKHGNPVNASDARMADAAVLKGLVAEGTAEGTKAMHLNQDSALEWRKSAYDAGVIGLTAVAGPVGGPAVEIFGNAMESSVLGDPVGGEGGTPANISPDEASRYVANALLADGVHLDVDPQYMIDGHVGSTEELSSGTSLPPQGTTLNDALTGALHPVLGANDPSTSFQLWYNQTISGS